MKNPENPGVGLLQVSNRSSKAFSPGRQRWTRMGGSEKDYTVSTFKDFLKVPLRAVLGGQKRLRKWAWSLNAERSSHPQRLNLPNYVQQKLLGGRSIQMSFMKHEDLIKNTHRVIILSIRRKRCKQVLGMISNCVLGDHPPPVCNIRIISERQYSNVGNILRKQRSRPGIGASCCSPCLFSIAS